MSEKKHPTGGKAKTNFEELEREFEKVLNELLTDESLERFRKEYEKLHSALVNSHISEQALMNKVRELNNEIAENAEKVATALRLSKEDESTITNLTQETEKGWKLVEYLQEKELWSRETITTLRGEIEQLKGLVMKSADLAVQFQNQETLKGSNLTNLMKREPQSVEPEEVPDNVEGLKKLMAEMEQVEEKRKNDIYIMQNDGRRRTLDLQRERSRRSKVETDLAERTTELTNLRAEMAEGKKTMDKLKDNLQKEEQSNKELSIANERALKDNDNVNAALGKLQQEMEKTLNHIDNMQLEIRELQNTLSVTEGRLFKLHEASKKMSKAKKALERKLKILIEQRAQLRKEKELTTKQLLASEKDLETGNKQREADIKQINNLMRERDIFNKNLIRQMHATEKQTNMVTLSEQTNRNMGYEIIGFRKESEKQRRIIQQLEKERDRYINDNGNLTVKVMQALEKVQVRDLENLVYQKNVEELESRLKIQQNLYEVVHRDRIVYRQRLAETQDEMSEQVNKLRVLEHQSHQLKEEVADREAAVVKEHQECLRLEKDKDMLVLDIQSLKQQLNQLDQVIIALKVEEKSLRKIISDCDKLIHRQNHEQDTLIGERDVLGSQLVRRNDEVSLLYQKIKLLQTLLNNGYKMYDQRIEDVRLLRLEIRLLRNKTRCLEKITGDVANYKQELYATSREVLQEKARCAALENELSHPRQVHRWRGLEVTDPSKFELLQKVQALQKRLIQRTEEVVEVEHVLQEKDRLYLQLRLVLERQPGPEATKQIVTYQRVLVSKNRQLKSLVAELNMSETNQEMEVYESRTIQKHLLDMKKKYFKEKKARQEAQDIKSIKKLGLPAIVPGKDQFTGGGFKISYCSKNAESSASPAVANRGGGLTEQRQLPDRPLQGMFKNTVCK